MRKIVRLLLFASIFMGGAALSLNGEVVSASGEDVEINTINSECLNMKHGLMMNCLKMDVEKLKKATRQSDAVKEKNKLIPWEAPEEYQERVNPIALDKESIVKGKELFSFSCSACHGMGGLGDGPASTNFGKQIANLTSQRLQKKTDGDIFWKITEGSWPMPAFWEGDVLSEKQIWQIINYVRSLAASDTM